MTRILAVLIIMLTISTKQLQCYREPLHDYNILSGVTGSGKSWIANLKWYETICQAPKNSLYLQTGNTEESLWDNITSPLLQIDKGVDWLEYKAIANKKRIVVKSTGTQIVCTGANTENAKDRIQGKNINGWYGDEIVKQPKSFVEMALSRCRTVENGRMIMTPVLWTCNPDSPSHYIKKEYIDKQDIDIKNWFFGFNDNPLIDKDYVAKVKKNFSGIFYDRMILGLWVLAEGQIYSEFSRSKHVVNTLPEFVEYNLAVDWGYENPLAILLVGRTGDNQYYVVDELCIRQQLVDESLRNILLDKWGAIYGFDTDAYCDTNRPEQMRQLAELFPQLTVVGAEKDVIDGIQEVCKYFKKRGNGEYGLYFHERCTITISEHENYRWKKNNKGINAKDEPIKELDHTCDGLRYLIYSRRNNFDFSNAPDTSAEWIAQERNDGGRRS